MASGFGVVLLVFQSFFVFVKPQSYAEFYAELRRVTQRKILCALCGSLCETLRLIKTRQTITLTALHAVSASSSGGGSRFSTNKTAPRHLLFSKKGFNFEMN